MSQGSPISDSLRRWTWTVGQLRARAQRVTRRTTSDPVASEALADEALELCSNLLVELAGAEAEIKKLREALQHEREDADGLFERIPIASVATDAAGVITAANRRAASLLNFSARHLVGKPLLPFTQDRQAFLGLLRSLPRDGGTSQRSISIRPREHRTMTVDIAVVPRTTRNASEWLWFLTPEVPGARTLESDSLAAAADMASQRSA
jgi:PAS domain-containing protein